MVSPAEVLRGHYHDTVTSVEGTKPHEYDWAEAILERLASEQSDPAGAVSGAGTRKRLPLTPIATRGAHGSALHKADPRQRP